MDNFTLKPCPFCGNTDIEVEREGTRRQSCVVACGQCWARVESGEIGYGSAWNTRVDLTAQRDRALEAVEKLREALSGLYHATCEADFPSIPDKYYHHVLNAQEALAATDPETVEPPKCDHCGSPCGTDCDGSSHYTPDGKEQNMPYCSSCGSEIPEGQGSSCSMCYGDVAYGRDGYYELEMRDREEQEQRQQEDGIPE